VPCVMILDEGTERYLNSIYLEHSYHDWGVSSTVSLFCGPRRFLGSARRTGTK